MNKKNFVFLNRIRTSLPWIQVVSTPDKIFNFSLQYSPTTLLLVDCSFSREELLSRLNDVCSRRVVALEKAHFQNKS